MVTQAAQPPQLLGSYPGNTAFQVTNFIAAGLLAAFLGIASQGRKFHCYRPSGCISFSPWVVTQAAQLLQPVGSYPGRPACQVSNFVAVGLLAAFRRIAHQGRKFHCHGPCGGVSFSPWVVTQAAQLLLPLGSHPGRPACQVSNFVAASLLAAFHRIAHQGRKFHCNGPSGGISFSPWVVTQAAQLLQPMGSYPGHTAFQVTKSIAVGFLAAFHGPPRPQISLLWASWRLSLQPVAGYPARTAASTRG